MATFYATYSASESTGSTVTATQGTTPWIVAGGGTAGSSGTAALTVQGIAGGTPVPISGSITATNPSVGATGSAVPASGTYIAGNVAGTLTGLTAKDLSTQVAAGDIGIVTNSVIHGLTTAGGGAYVDVKVNPSGALTVDATQSGTWNITNVSGTVSLPTGAATEATLAKIPVAQASTTSGQSGALVQGAVTTSAPSYTTAQTSPLSLTTAGALRVDASGSTQPISGTVAVTQSTSPWIVAGGGTAGTAASGVVTVQGVASMTPVQVSQATASNLNATVSQATGTNLHTVVDSGTITTVSTVTSVTNTVTTDQVATTAATFQDGSILFSSLTTSFATVITAGGDLRNVSMRNNTNGVVVVSLDSGSTTAYTLDSGDAVSLDLKSLGRKIASGVTLQAKYSGGAPTSGSIRINGVY